MSVLQATAATLRNGSTTAPTPASPRLDKELIDDAQRGTSMWSKFSRVLHVRRKGSSEEQQQQRNTISDQKARITLGVIMGTFLVCWTPFFLVNIWRSWDHVNKELSQAVTWLGYANSALNPVIYSIFNRDFRRAFKKIIVKLFSCFDTGKKNYGCVRNGVTDGMVDRKRSYTRSSDTPENNNLNRGEPVATRLVLLNNNESSVIVEE
ncbi:unnamed protein product, partial [Mesorhabditis spiculigera]